MLYSISAAAWYIVESMFQALAALNAVCHDAAIHVRIFTAHCLLAAPVTIYSLLAAPIVGYSQLAAQVTLYTLIVNSLVTFSMVFY